MKLVEGAGQEVLEIQEDHAMKIHKYEFAYELDEYCVHGFTI